MQLIVTLKVPALSPEHAEYVAEVTSSVDCLFGEVVEMKAKAVREAVVDPRKRYKR